MRFSSPSSGWRSDAGQSDILKEPGPFVYVTTLVTLFTFSGSDKP